MKRLAQLNYRLHPWITIKPTAEDLLNTLPTNLWDQLLKDTGKLTGLTRFWFRAGICRALAEIERKDVDGNPAYRTRQELIDHLKTIDQP